MCSSDLRPGVWCSAVCVSRSELAACLFRAFGLTAGRAGSYNPSRRVVPVTGITGKSGVSPARFRHCEDGRAASNQPLSVVLGKVKPPTPFGMSPPSQETYPRCTRLPFCGYRKHALVSGRHASDSVARLPSAAAL